LDTVDAKNIIKAAKKEGHQEGREEGFQDGHREGGQEGIQIGINQARQSVYLKIAKAMLQSGMPLEQVVLLTQLSESDIKALESLDLRP